MTQQRLNRKVKGVTINQYEGRTEGCNKGVIAPLLYQPTISVTCSAAQRANYLFLRQSPKNVGSVKCWHQLGIENVLKYSVTDLNAQNVSQQ